MLRRGVFSPRTQTKAAALALVAAIGLAFGGYRSVHRVLPAAGDPPGPSGIAPLYRQITAHKEPAPAGNRMISVAAEGLGFAASFLRVEEDAAATVVTMPVNLDRLDPRLGRGAGSTTVAGVGGRWTGLNAGLRGSVPDDLSGAAALLFNSSFSSLFGRLFDSQGDASGTSGDGSAAEERNPFAEVRQKEQAAGRESADAVENSAPLQKNEAKAASPPQQDASALAGGGVEPSRFVLLGDFDGSGVLGAVVADRSGETEFVFPDGEQWTLSLFVNPSAIEYQRSLALEDIDGDGAMDLLVTSRASLFGGILLGDGDGGFRVAGSFLTGYEPILAAAGPKRQGGREIMTVNLRTGTATAFRPEGNYRKYRASQLDFAPDYIAHVVELATGSDYLAAAQIGLQPRLYRWMPDSSLQSQDASLPAEPSLEVGADPRLRAGLDSIRIHQVGSYASVVVGNSSGQSFNVASVRISPQFCLVIGDLERRGNLDVGIGTILSLGPSK